MNPYLKVLARFRDKIDFETIEEVLSFLKQRDLKDRDIMRHGGIVKL